MMLLGRRLLAPLTTATAEEETKQSDVCLQRIQLDDRFFCDTMELIPPQYYFPTDEEANWLRSAPKMAKKYHKNVKAALPQESSKKSIKRAKYNPNEQKTNEERQLEAAEEEKNAKKQQQQEQEKEKPVVQMAPLKSDKNPTTASMEGLKERLALKIQQMREQRKADEKAGKKRKENGTAKIEPASKKRKTTSGNTQKGTKQQQQESSTTEEQAKESSASTVTPEVSTASISYGSLLLDDDADKNKNVKKTRNGQGIRGIKNLLKKAERNQQRMEELKKTEEGRAIVQAKGWDKAIKQASGEVVMDDPKLLRNKLKKKEKKKAKSAKEWKARVTQQEMAKKEKQKKKLENMRGGKKTDDDAESTNPKSKKRKTGANAPRAGFEGKKGEQFLNAGDKKHFASKTK